MMVRIQSTADELDLRWPLAPRLVRYLPALVASGLWIPFAFAVATASSLRAMTAMALGLGPPLLALAVIAPRLASEFSRRALTLARRDGKIAVGGIGLCAREQLALIAASERRWGREWFIVALVVRLTVGEQPAELELLHERLRSREQADRLAKTIRDFLDA